MLDHVFARGRGVAEFACAILALALAACLMPDGAIAAQPASQGGEGLARAVQASPIKAQAAKKAAKYKVVFKANGGKGTMGAQSVKRGKRAALRANAFTRSGYKFVGWNTKRNGKGKSYKNKAKVKNLAKAGKTVKLYAQWKKISSPYVVKTNSYSFTIPESWQGKVVWTVQNNIVNPWNNVSSDCLSIYLKGHNGDNRYSLVNICSPTGFGDTIVDVCAYRRKDGKGFVGLLTPNWPLKIWYDRNTSYSSSKIDIPISDQEAMLELVTGGGISYQSAASDYAIAKNGSSVIKGYLNPLFRKAFKSKEYYFATT